MRASIRHVGVLVACLSVGAVAVAATASPPDARPKVRIEGRDVEDGKSSPAQKEADAFLATVTGLAVRRCRPAPAAPTGPPPPTSRPSTSASAPAPTRRWRRCQRLDDRHRQDQGAAQERKAAGRADRPPAAQAAARPPPRARARSPRSSRSASSSRRKQSAILDGYTFCLQPQGQRLRQADHRQRHRRHPEEVARSQRAAAHLDGVEGDRPAAEAGPDRAGQAAQPGGARAGLPLVLRAAGRRLRHDRRRDDEAARRHARDDEAALRRAALLGQEPAGRALQAPGARS